MVFAFIGTAVGGQLTKKDEASDFGYFLPGEEPENSFHWHLERVVDAVDLNRTATVFKAQLDRNDDSRG